ncbi:MAG TPA: hypothetical protein DCX06_00310 [Opitutae bacterium]|nr:hypothetical protein [Opitutae bacterium]
MNVIALHGFTGCGADFAPLAETCVGKWNCPDLPGHGKASNIDCSVESTLSYLRSYCQKHSTPRVLVGYSMGARAALNLIIQDSNHWRGLIVLSPNPGIEDPMSKEARIVSDAHLAERIESHGIEAFMNDWQSLPIIQSQQNIRKSWLQNMNENRLRHTANGLSNSLRNFGQGVCPNLWPQLGNLQLPVLCITGENDTKYCQISQRMCAILPNGRHEIIDDAGHMPHLENPEQSFSAIDQFLTQFA